MAEFTITLPAGTLRNIIRVDPVTAERLDGAWRYVVCFRNRHTEREMGTINIDVGDKMKREDIARHLLDALLPTLLEYSNDAVPELTDGAS